MTAGLLTTSLTMATKPGLMSDPALLWYANRGTGFVLLVMLTFSMMMGVLATARVSPRLWPRMLSQGLHRNVALLSFTFLTVHVVTAVLDSFVDIKWWYAFVPFQGTYEPLWLGLGTVSVDLMIAVTLTSVLRHRMSHRPWRVIHITAYGAWGMGIIHGLQIGTDASTVWGTAMSYGCIAAVFVTILARVGLLAHPKLVTT
jgi:sulfoxide reductase heme-binding subunit YedZ